MGIYTLRLANCAPTESDSDEPGEYPEGWHVAVQGMGEGDGEVGSQMSIIYPFNISIEKNIRWYLETFPTKTPWMLRQAAKIQKQISDYAVGIFRQLPILHQIGISPDIDTIIIDVSDQEFGGSPSNIFRLHWEFLESPEVWDELWDLNFPPKRLRKREPIPKVMIRRTVYRPGHFGNIQAIDWGESDLSDDSDHIVTSSFTTSHQYDGRRSIAQDQKVDYNVMGMGTLISQRVHVKLSFFRILLVVARRIDTEKDTQPRANDTEGDNASPEVNRLAPDLDPSLISEPLLEAIGQLSESLDVRLDLCRPGSWAALQSLLEERGEGYYDLVHFDLHGGVLRSRGSVKFAYYVVRNTHVISADGPNTIGLDFTSSHQRHNQIELPSERESSFQHTKLATS
jgi:hypothetical protein